MAQSGYTPISLYYSSSTGTSPTAGNMVAGELAINTADGILFYKNPSNVVTPLSSSGGSLSWQAVQSANFTAAAGNGYYVNTTSAAITVTLPASPTAGQFIALVDYAGTFATNNLTINPNGNKFLGATNNIKLATNREAIAVFYVDATQGWLIYDGFNASIPASAVYSANYLVVAGGGSGGGLGAGGGGGLLSGTTTLNIGTAYTITVGAGGAGTNGGAVNSGGNSAIVSLITSIGGGPGAAGSGNGNSGGSGGGAGSQIENTNSGGSGTVGQGYAGGDTTTNSTNNYYAGGGGGGAGAVGGTGNSRGGSTGGAGGAGAASSITGSSVTYAGGGGGGAYIYLNPGSPGAGGSGGGGSGGTYTVGANNGTSNTGGGGGGAGYGYIGTTQQAGSGGSGVVILSVPTANYSGTTTGSPTVTTSGSNTIIKFTASGSYTA